MISADAVASIDNRVIGDDTLVADDLDGCFAAGVLLNFVPLLLQDLFVGGRFAPTVSSLKNGGAKNAPTHGLLQSRDDPL